MSKIQDALQKIQKNRGDTPKARPARSSEPDASQSVVIAALVSGDEESEYNGKRLHVDQRALRDAALIAPEYHVQLFANQYREIKRPLIAHAFGKRATRVELGHLIMICSALSGEGKTFTSINLALSMAQERDHQVLLVDADVAKPHISDLFGAQGEPGLLDALEDTSIDPRTLILPTDLPGLSILPAGSPRANATELLASSAMQNVTRLLGSLTEGQIVLFDSPPLLQTTEAKVLADLAGQVVVVVRAGSTPQEAVKAALASIDQSKPVNMILNQARGNSGHKPYGYGYGSGGSVNEEVASNAPDADSVESGESH
ncbi:MAG: AAA family ATPase [Pseudomonadota bacterium]